MAAPSRALPLVLLHGIPVTSTIWDDILEPLRELGPVLAPDLLGLGSAEHPDIDYGPADYSAWLDGVLAGVEGRLTLVVHDFGGPVGLQWAVEHPERIARLVIMNTSIYADSTPLTKLARSPAAVSVLGRLMLGSGGFGLTMRGMFRFNDKGRIQEYQRSYQRPEDRRTVNRVVANWSSAGLREIAAGLPQLTCPVLLLWGMRDRYIFPWRPHGERFLQDLPQARVVQVPKGSHFLQAEQPAAVLKALRDFVDE